MHLSSPQSPLEPSRNSLTDGHLESKLLEPQLSQLKLDPEVPTPGDAAPTPMMPLVHTPVLATNLKLTPPTSASSTAPHMLLERSAPPLKTLIDSEEFKMTEGHEVGYLVNTIKNKIFKQG